jgi:hypothetical protein
VGHWPVSWTARASGKSMDFPGVVGKPLPLVVRFRRKDRFPVSTPLVEKPPALLETLQTSKTPARWDHPTD